MEDAWDWVQEELKKIEVDMPADPEMMQVVDAISVADFWKRRYDEERMLWERKLEIKEDEKKDLQGKAQAHEMSIRELELRFRELERRWEQEKLMLEDRLRTKEIEASLEKAQLAWEGRIKLLEEENRSLKNQSGGGAPGAVMPAGGAPVEALRRQVEKHLAERDSLMAAGEEAAKRHLDDLAREKSEVARALEQKEQELSRERNKWSKLEGELGRMSEQMTRQLTNLKDREEEHFVILEDLARGFAHRVRNYLGIISGTVQLSMVNYKMEGELEEQMKVVDQNVQEMLKSIEEFLGLARIPEMTIETCSVVNIFEGIDAGLRDQLRSKSITLTENFAADLPQVKCDRKLFEQAVRNLIENSMEAMPNGGKLGVSAQHDRGTIVIKIADTGAGISENHIKKVFQPYFSSKKNHLGLGLTRAKRAVDLHRGTLALESVKGQGTTVTITLYTEAR